MIKCAFAFALAMATMLPLSAETVTKGPLQADSPSTTSSGTQFILPANWRMSEVEGKVTLETPEPGSQVVLVDVKAKGIDAAVAAAWKVYAPPKTWPLQLSTDGSPSDGWDQIRHYAYEVSANEKRTVGADAYRHGNRYTVVIYDMDNAILGKRGSQLGTISDRLLPAGYKRETFSGRKAHPLDDARLAQLKDFVERARKAYDVPGIGIGIIDHGKVVFAGGFGTRELGRSDPVDGETLFMIASNTKALTTLMLARAVDAKKFTWTTPVTQVYPPFKLGDADTTRQVQIRHLICACTGMPRQDMEWILNDANNTPSAIFGALGKMQPTSKFGELFQYSNLMAAAAGYVGAHAFYPNEDIGTAYDKVMQEQVFGPLGMKRTIFDDANVKTTDHATPHSLDADGHTAIAGTGIIHSIRAARPAGGAWSSVNDMLRYVQMELAKGVLPNGQRYVSESALLERRKPNVAIGSTETYGMGLMVDHTWGVDVVHHGGDLPGFHSDMIWLPEQQVGAVILTNADTGPYIRGPFQRRLLEILFDGKPTAQGDIDSGVRELKAAIEAARKRLTIPADPAAVARLASHYTNDALGTITVDKQGGKVFFDFGSWKSEVASRKNDDGSTSFVTISPGESDLEFVLGGTSAAPTLVVRDFQHEYVYAVRK